MFFQHIVFKFVRITIKNFTYEKTLFFLLAFIALVTVSAQSAGIFENYAILTIGSGGTPQYYDLQATTSNPDFNGANLDTFYVNSSLIVNGGQNKVYKCNGGDITDGKTYYRVRSTPGTATFSSVDMNWVSNDSGAGTGCQNQTWEGQSGSTNLISGLAPGTYYLDIYTTASTNLGTGTITSDNNGSYFTATFVVTDVLGLADFADLSKKSVVSEGKLYTAQKGELNIQVYDFTGKAEKTLRVNANGKPVDINLQQKGLYLMKISNGQTNEVVKFSY